MDLSDQHGSTHGFSGPTLPIPMVSNFIFDPWVCIIFDTGGDQGCCVDTGGSCCHYHFWCLSAARWCPGHLLVVTLVVAAVDIVS